MAESVGIITYSHGRLDERIATLCKQTLSPILPIASVYLLNGPRGYPVMVKQIIAALGVITAESVYFCEHDVLYHASHFTFLPPRTDTFYYNTHVFRWDTPSRRCITYDHLISLSGLCCNRLLALAEFTNRLQMIEKAGLLDYSTEHGFFRDMGYEPQPREEWKAAYPNIDIRHRGSFTRVKCKLTDFKKRPEGWTETTIDSLPGWDTLALCDALLPAEPASSGDI